MTPFLTVRPAGGGLAADCGLNRVVRTLDGALRVYAEKPPAAAFSAELTLLSPSGVSVGSGGLPAATSETLGGVRVREGSGLRVDESGNLSVDRASAEELEDLFDRE